MNMKKPFKKKVTTTTVTDYWDCGQGHNHLTELVALKCHKKVLTKKLNPNLVMSPADRRERNRKILNYWADGKSMTATAMEFKLSKSTIYSTVHRFTRCAARAKILNRSLAPTLTEELKDKLLKTKLGRESIFDCIEFLEEEKAREVRKKLPKIRFFDNDGKFIGWENIKEQLDEDLPD